MPMLTLILAFVAVGGGAVAYVTDRQNIDTSIYELDKKTDARFISLQGDIGALAKSVKGLSEAISGNSQGRWRMQDMALWCSQMAVLNQDIKFRCLDPRYTLGLQAIPSIQINTLSPPKQEGSGQ